MSVHINNSNIYGSPIVIGNDNVLIDSEDWKMLQDNLKKVVDKLPKSSEEYEASKEALDYAVNKNGKSLVNTIKNNIVSFSSDLFKSVASGVLIEFVSSFVL